MFFRTLEPQELVFGRGFGGYFVPDAPGWGVWLDDVQEFGRRQLHVGALMPFFKGGLALSLAYYAGPRHRPRPRGALSRRAFRGGGLLRGPAARALPSAGGLLHHVRLLRSRDGRPVHGPPALPAQEDRRPPGRRRLRRKAMNVVLVGPVWFPRGSAASARLRNLALGLRDCGAPGARHLHGAPAPGARRGRWPGGWRSTKASPTSAWRRPRRPPWAGATPSGRSRACAAAFSTRSGGSPACTPPPPSPAEGSATGSPRASATSSSSTTGAPSACFRSPASAAPTACRRSST